jgi:methylated-DNA-[protein]-cysteine S-methyltransferase
MSTRQVDSEASGRFRTPWGPGTVRVSEGRLVGVELPLVSGSGTTVTLGGSAAPPGEAGPVDRAVLDRWVGELEAYFSGDRLSWRAEDIPLEDLAFAAFERAVYGALLSVPPGVMVSYGTLAEMAGFPRAARAVGNAMAANAVPVVIPCHRVVRADGTLGNYGNDPAWKQRLLAHEWKHAGPTGGGR